MFDPRLIQNFNWGLVIITGILVCMGLVTLHSAANTGSPMPHIYMKQVIWYSAGLMILLIILFINYKRIKDWSYILYAMGILMLIGVALFGKCAGGSKRWLVAGPISIQPSEMMKVAVILALSRYYSQRMDRKGFTFYELLVPMLMTGIPFILIAKQPDLGTAMIIFLIAVSITLFVKVRLWTLIGIAVAGIAASPPIWLCLKEYQKRRILTFLNNDLDPLGAGYHIIQSKIAIGSGMITGKGLMKGSQNNLSFIPEHHTDFIFSVLAEEMGFIGAFVLIVAFLLLIVWGLNIAHGAKDPYAVILSVGISGLIFWQAFINIGMVMGVMPVVGVPLPFISYGGSSIMTMMICIGLLLNVSMRRFMYNGN